MGSTVHRAVGVAIVVAQVISAAADAGADTSALGYEPPVDAPVVDPFRAPTTRYGPGNRGLTYDVAPPGIVRASAPGRVVFAGSVGVTRHVTILHADGLRTSYSFLEQVLVRRGEQVEGGDVLGTAATGFHFGIRRGDTYLDPSAILGAVATGVRLVPHDEPVPETPASLAAEHAALRELVAAESPSLWGRGLDLVWRLAEPHARPWIDKAQILAHVAQQFHAPSTTVEIAAELWHRATAECTPAGAAGRVVPRAVERRTAVLVGGWTSSSAEAAIDDVDLRGLGYDRANVVRFSYRGGRVPTTAALDPALAAIESSEYRGVDTGGDLWAQGRDLADLLEAAAAARPGEPVDVYGHSMGGLVVRTALSELAARPGGRLTLDALGSVATIGTPHSGSDAATLAMVVADMADPVLTPARLLTDVPFDPGSESVRQMSEVSGFVERLGRDGVPPGVEFRTIAARGDVWVTADKADVDGHHGTVIDRMDPGAHAGLPGDPQTTDDLRLGLVGLAPRCEGFADAVLDVLVPEAYSLATDGVTTALLWWDRPGSRSTLGRRPRADRSPR